MPFNTKCKSQDRELHARTTSTGGVAAVAPCASRRLTIAACPASQAAHRGQPPSGCASMTRFQHSMRSSCHSKRQGTRKQHETVARTGPHNGDGDTNQRQVDLSPAPDESRRDLQPATIASDAKGCPAKDLRGKQRVWVPQLNQPSLCDAFGHNKSHSTTN